MATRLQRNRIIYRILILGDNDVTKQDIINHFIPTGVLNT